MNKPQTFEAAIDHLMSLVNKNREEVEELVAEGELAFVGQTHMVMGRWVRNEWGLWGKQGGLYEHFIDLGLGHADDMSGILMTTLYRRLADQPDDIRAQVNGYKQFWKNQGVDALTLEDF